MAAVSVLLLGACAPHSILPHDTKVPAESASSSTAATTDTVAAQVTTTSVADEPSGADEELVQCDNAAFRDAFKTKMIMDRCTTTWAVGNSDKDTWNCPKAGCRQVNLYHLSGTWAKTAVCDSTQPLTYWKGSCYHEDMSPVTAADIPPPSVQCKLWRANTSITYIEMTGCPLTKEVINDLTTGKCTGWTQNLILPIVKCDSGPGVRAAQAALRKAGMSNSVDGYFGPGTARAVYDWQKKNGITPTGMIDLASWKALFPGNAGLRGKDANGDGTITPDEL